MDVGDTIRKARKEKHWPQAVLAREVGASRETIANWEVGKRRFPMPIFRKQLKRVLGIDLKR